VDRRGIACVLRHHSQPSRYAVECRADLCLDPRPHCRVVDAEHHALRKPSRSQHQNGTDDATGPDSQE
jgi:hypothetical protein